MSDRRTGILQAATRVIARRGVRGLRMGELAAEAGVSTALIYYHFTDRAGILRQTLEYIGDRADHYTAEDRPAPDQGRGDARDPRADLEQVLLLELQDSDEVRENSTAWGELRATAVFEPELRQDLARSTHGWVHDIAGLLSQADPTRTAPAHTAAAERLTALVEGLSVRWLSGSLPIEQARRLLRGAVDAELDGPAPGAVAGAVGAGFGES
ncbi:TetR/AcrR family transcriptional regulator [Kitasatospora sp. NPDC051170]|uniref:TetR/AcrR family transcriptional regulator n=1 Tax=Kitasatospora sp. NPDC051170 TaxID=3364056 RepID=UPI0037B17B52